MDELMEYKLYLSLALNVSRGNTKAVREIIASIPKDSSYEILSKFNILSLILVVAPTFLEPCELTFVKEFIYDDVEYKELGYEVELYDTTDHTVLEQQYSTLCNFVTEQALKYHWQKAEKDKEYLLFMFVKARTLKVATFHNENVFFNEDLFRILPLDYAPFHAWKDGFLKPLDFTIKHGEFPNVLELQNDTSVTFDYLIKYIEYENVSEFLAHSIIPFVKHNNCWYLLTEWLKKKTFLSVADYAMLLKCFEYFFNDLTDDAQNFLNDFVGEYIYKVYSGSMFTDDILSIMSETVQYCIIHHDKKLIIDSEGENPVIDDEYIKKHFCNNTLENLKYLLSLIDSASKLVKITNNNESLMSILIISISSSTVQLNFAKLLIHNFKINDGHWETFLLNFNWLIELSVVFKKIQNYECINKINEILFEILLSLNLNELINKYLLINFNSNPTLKKILLKYCWHYFVKAKNFSLEKDELLTVKEIIKNFDLDFDNEIQSANNFYLIYKNSLDIYNPDDESKFIEFDSYLVNNKPITDFITDINVNKITNINRDFGLCENLNFEILKFKKLLIATNQLVTNFKFRLNDHITPLEIYCINNPLLILEKLLELNSKSYQELNKFYRIMMDLCISMDKIGLIYDVSLFESTGSAHTNEDFDDFNRFAAYFQTNVNPKEIKDIKPITTKFPLKDKLISSCINYALIDLNFEFAFDHSIKLLNNETGTSLESLGYIWLTIFQVCKFVDPNWLNTGFHEDYEELNDDPVQIPLDILTKQIELISKLLEVVPSSTSISAAENKIILNHANYLINKYHKKLCAQVVNDFNSYQYQQSSSIFKNFNASTGTLLNQFTKNTSNINNSNLTINRRNHQQDSINSSPISAFNSPRNSQIDGAPLHSAISMARTPAGNNSLAPGPGLENRFVRAFASSASELFKGDPNDANDQGMNRSASNNRINLMGGEEQIKNLFVSGLGWAIGANPQDSSH